VEDAKAAVEAAEQKLRDAENGIVSEEPTQPEAEAQAGDYTRPLLSLT